MSAYNNMNSYYNNDTSSAEMMKMMQMRMLHANSTTNSNPLAWSQQHPQQQQLTAPTSISSLLSMSDVVESPYETSSSYGGGGRSAEVQEELFQQLDSYLSPCHKSSTTTQQPQQQQQHEASIFAQHQFGKEVANRLVRTKRRIEASGILYEPGWADGIIQGHLVVVGKLPRHLLLLCLHDRSLVYADKNNIELFTTIVNELGLCYDFVCALKEWEMTKQYPRASLCRGVNLFQPSDRVACLKCIIFLCRIWHASRILNQKELGASLENKISGCLYVLDSSARATMPSLPSFLSFEGDKEVVLRKARAHLPPSGVDRSKLCHYELEAGFRHPTDVLDVAHQSHPVLFTAQERRLYWYPIEETEQLLNPIETELAWLLEEVAYCRRTSCLWDFISEHASPDLQSQLDRLPESESDQTKPAKLVRLHIPSVNYRFEAFREDVCKRLFRGECRPAMNVVIPYLRRESDPEVVLRRQQAERDLEALQDEIIAEVLSQAQAEGEKANAEKSTGPEKFVSLKRKFVCIS